MQPIELRPSIYWIGVNDRQTELFEGLWSIRDEGISYNSYLILDKKNVMVNLSSKMTWDELFEQVRSLIDPSRLDYIVINHMEPDHTGALKALMMAAPQAKLLGTTKTRDMLASFYGLTNNVQVVSDGEELDLGEHTLRFLATPFVHWPETMMTYETTQKVLFSCDGFGGYGALNGCIFDEPSQPLAWYEEQALRYFTNIVSSFSKPVKNAIAKLENLPLDIVAPSHGLVWRNHPRRIVDLYQRWASYSGGPGDCGVTILYGSMYGNTERLMENIAQGVADEGVAVNVFNVTRSSISEIIPSLWLKRGVVVGAPTYEGKLFPDMVMALHIAARKHITGKLCAGFGSNAWGGGGQRDLKDRAAKLNWEFFGNLEFTGSPSENELQEGRRFGAEFARAVKEK